MSRFDFWTQRLAEVTMDAKLTKNPEHRVLYLELAEHYTLMARMCARKTSDLGGDDGEAEDGSLVSRSPN